MKVEFRGKISSPAIEELTRKKLERVEKYFKGEEPSFVVSFDIENKDHVVRMETNYNSFNLQAKAKSQDMYKSLDLCLENIKSQMLKNKFDKKTKRTHHVYDEGRDSEL